MSADLLRTATAAARRAADERARRQPHVMVAPAGGRASNGERFTATLRAPGLRVIAECKRRSPSRGVLRTAYDPAAIARAYAAAGAAAISVLTEPTFFDGALAHLAQVRSAVDTPLLRKDFIVTESQVAEARLAGADAVLLIAAALPRPELESLLAAAAREGLAALVEVHDRLELETALGAGARAVGVNSRNLRTLAVETEVLDALAPHIPAGIIAVAESGLRTREQLDRLRAVRYDAFLIGERFMTEGNPGEALARLLAGPSEEPR